MLPRRLTVSDVPVVYPAVDTYVRATATGAAAKLRDDQKYAKCSPSGSTVYTLVPLSLESYGCLGQPAGRFLDELANLPSSAAAADKPSFIDSHLQELPMSLRRGSYRIVAAYAALQTSMTRHTIRACFETVS